MSFSRCGTPLDGCATLVITMKDPSSADLSGNPGVRKRVPRNVRERMILIQIVEAQHRALLRLAAGTAVDIDELNDTVRSLIGQLGDF